MLAACLSALALLLALRLLRTELSSPFGRGSGERVELARASSLFRELEELLSAGLLPKPERWEEVAALAAPWGPLAHESLCELRSRGGQVLPTLRRLRSLTEAQSRDLLQGKARSASALAQALGCAALVPLVSGALYLLLPDLAGHR